MQRNLSFEYKEHVSRNSVYLQTVTIVFNPDTTEIPFTQYIVCSHVTDSGAVAFNLNGNILLETMPLLPVAIEHAYTFLRTDPSEWAALVDYSNKYSVVHTVEFKIVE